MYNVLNYIASHAIYNFIETRRMILSPIPLFKYNLKLLVFIVVYKRYLIFDFIKHENWFYLIELYIFIIIIYYMIFYRMPENLLLLIQVIKYLAVQFEMDT